ncbi:unnamed protein product [Camellia sinensis]
MLFERCSYKARRRRQDSPVAKIREAAYDADDAIDTFIVKVTFRKGTGILNVLMRYSCVVKDYIAIHKVGVEIESIKTKISDITSRFQTYNVRAISERESLSSSRYEKQRLLLQSYPHIMEEVVVGLDKNSRIFGERERVSSCFHLGDGCKTTLAKKVYNYIDVSELVVELCRVQSQKKCFPTLPEKKKLQVAKYY